MKTIKILIMGDAEWISKFETDILSQFDINYVLEKITEIDAALNRLDHNSYDILLLQDGFAKRDSLYLTSMAYAMTRPSVIICDSLFSFIKRILWKKLTKFFRKYKISNKLINISIKSDKNILGLIKNLAYNHLKYFDAINREIGSNKGL